MTSSLSYTKSESKLKSHLPAPVPPLPGSWRILFSSSSGRGKQLTNCWTMAPSRKSKSLSAPRVTLGQWELPWLNQLLSQRIITCSKTRLANLAGALPILGAYATESLMQWSALDHKSIHYQHAWQSSGCPQVAGTTSLRVYINAAHATLQHLGRGTIQLYHYHSLQGDWHEAASCESSNPKNFGPTLRIPHAGWVLYLLQRTELNVSPVVCSTRFLISCRYAKLWDWTRTAWAWEETTLNRCSDNCVAIWKKMSLPLPEELLRVTKATAWPCVQSMCTPCPDVLQLNNQSGSKWINKL